MRPRIIHLALLLAAFLAACDQPAYMAGEETDGMRHDETGLPIGFRPYLAQTEVTRAQGDGMLTDETLRQRGFGVYCWYTGTVPFSTFMANASARKDGYLLMLNQEVTYGEDHLWGYSPSRYWPVEPGHMLTFRAYAPYRSAPLPSNAEGLPVLPVHVCADDYANGTQQDPLWGTGRNDNSSDYGNHYTDYTVAMSGDGQAKDAADGTIHWYFHHGMTKIQLLGRLAPDASADEITVTRIRLGDLYTDGTLDISSPANHAGDVIDKPVWTDRTGNMTIDLTGTSLTGTPLTKDDYTDLLDQPLLVIPRNFADGSPLTITVTFTAMGIEQEVSATILQDMTGNTAYVLDLILDSSNPTMTVFLRVDHNWQTGSHFTIDDL